MTERLNNSSFHLHRAPGLGGGVSDYQSAPKTQGQKAAHSSSRSKKGPAKRSEMMEATSNSLKQHQTDLQQQYLLTGSNRIMMASKGVAPAGVSGNQKNGGGTQQLYFAETSPNTQGLQETQHQKKAKRLRKNFDMLAQAMKNSNPIGAGAKINSAKVQRNLIGEGSSRNAYGAPGGNFFTEGLPAQHAYSVFSQVQMVQNQQVPQSAHAEQILAYGSTHTKDRKGSTSQAPSGYYDALFGNNGKQFHSQRAGSQTSSRQTNIVYNLGPNAQVNDHNTSMYSQISLKENSPQKQTPLGGISTRNHLNQGLVFNQPSHHSFSSHQNTQPLNLPLPPAVAIDKPHFLKTNIGHLKKGGGNSSGGPPHAMVSTSNSRKSNDNLLPLSHQMLPQAVSSQSQESASRGGGAGGAILNINTASDINIYNNSFIVNTGPGNQNRQIQQTSKKQNNPSRSNSIKRTNGSVVQQNMKLNHPQAPSRNHISNLNSALVAQAQQPLTHNNNPLIGGTMSLQNIMLLNNQHNGDQQARKTGYGQQTSQRGRSGAGLSGQQIKEAYTTQHLNFFQPGQSFGQTGGLLQNMPLNLTEETRKTSSKKMVKLQSGKKKHSSSSQQQLLPVSFQQLHPHPLLFPSGMGMGASASQHHQMSHNNQQQQSQTQSFDLQPFNYTSSNFMKSSASNSASQQHYKLAKRVTGVNGGGQTKLHFASNANVQRVKSNSLNKLMKRDLSAGQMPNNQSEGPGSADENGEYALNMAKNQAMKCFTMGKKKVIEKEYGKAIELFTQCIKIDPSAIEAKFYRAISKLDCGMVREAVLELVELLQIDKGSSQYSPVCHILLSIAYNRLNEQQLALNILNDCIGLFPAYPDAYQARGQAFLFQEKYQEALHDFQRFTSFVPQNGMPYIGVGDSHKALKQWPQAISAYSKALQLFQKDQIGFSRGLQLQTMQALLKRGLSYYHCQKYLKSMNDLQAVIKQDVTCIKAHFYIGKILSKQYLGEIRTKAETSKQRQKIQNEAILHFEQVVKYHQESGEVYAGNALFEISKLRLHEKDFYEAYFNLKRAVDSNFSSKRLQLYKDFTEGVLYLIKRKIKKGVQILSDLLEVLVNSSKSKKDQKQVDYLKHQSYIYRAYGYVAIEKYEVALQDIRRAKRLAKLDPATAYNKLLAKGILRMDHEDFIMATKYFGKASKKFTANKDPYCLHIISMVRSFTYSHAGMSIDQEDKLEQVQKAKEFMDFAINQCNSKLPNKVPSLYFFRGLLYFQMHMFYQALQDFNVAIEEEEEPTASYYLARGRTYACLSILTEAMKDLSIALNLDETFQEAYIYRGKCAYLLGDNNLAFLDFQRLILTDPKNPMVHVYAGNLLMTTGAYQDAIKAFMNADTVAKTAIAAFQRARCYCALTDLENAKMQFKIALQICKTEKIIQIDSQILTSLMRVINSSNGLNKAETSKKQIQQSLETLEEIITFLRTNQLKQLKKKDSELNIQIIPNVKRIKLEKVAVAKELQQQQKQQKDQEGQAKGADTSLATEELQAQSSTLDFDELNQYPLHSYYYENVFSLEDLYLFRAVFNFYAQDYDRAVEDYQYCQQLKLNDGAERQSFAGGIGDNLPMTPEHHNAESMKAYSHSSTPMLSMHSSKTDLSDVGLCSLNVHETNFNILLCHLMTGQYPKALERVNELIQQTPVKYQKHFFFLRGLLYENQGLAEKAQKDYARYEKQEPKMYEAYFKEGKDMVFEPFPVKNRLCSRFENKSINIISQFIKKQGAAPKVLVRPSFSMPFIKPPNMIPNIDEESIQNEFTLKQIDAPMPEAPWIRRWGGSSSQADDLGNNMGIKFTDNILMDDEEGQDDVTDDNGGVSQTLPDEDDESALTEDKSQRGGVVQAKKKRDFSEGKIEPKRIPAAKRYQQQDESPYLQSIEVPSQANRLRTVSVGAPTAISEQIFKQQSMNAGVGGGEPNSALMVYQFVGDAIDLDQLSDKHKISLFDDSRYEPAANTLGQISLSVDHYGVDDSKQRRILRKDNSNGLEAGDSLYDEQLLINCSLANEEAQDSDEDSSSSNSNSSSSSSVTSQNKRKKRKINQIGSKTKTKHYNYPVDNSTVLMGDALASQVVSKKQAKKKNPSVLLKNKKQKNSKLSRDENPAVHSLNDDEQDSSAFRSRQSSKL